MRAVGVSSHRRSGTHLLRYACQANFRYEEVGPNLYHRLPNRIHLRHYPRLYITRPWEEVARSLWAVREWFGAGADTFEEFQTQNWSDQWKEFPKVRLRYNYWKRSRIPVVRPRVPFSEALE